MCPWCGEWFEVSPDAFQDEAGYPLEFIVVDCPKCRRMVVVYEGGETERVLAIWGDYIETESGRLG